VVEASGYVHSTAAAVWVKSSKIRTNNNNDPKLKMQCLLRIWLVEQFFPFGSHVCNNYNISLEGHRSCLEWNLRTPAGTRRESSTPKTNNRTIATRRARIYPWADDARWTYIRVSLFFLSWWLVWINKYLMAVIPDPNLFFSQEVAFFNPSGYPHFIKRLNRPKGSKQTYQSWHGQS
jgi:hypothetical protein